MFRSAARSTSRRLLSSKPQSSGATRRFLSTAPPAQKSRSWKSSAVRWVIAGAGIYYYNTSTVFAEQPEEAISRLDESIHHVQESTLPTLEAIAEEKRQRQAETIAQEKQAAASALVVEHTVDHPVDDEAEGGSMEDLEEEADQQQAFNPETGEINWDCPCLGGMAHGPCGEEFKAAFSCFVYSNEEPKGMECIDKFKGMQDCFRLHPEMYGSEIQDDEDEVEEEIRADIAAGEAQQPTSSKPRPEADETLSVVKEVPAPQEEPESPVSDAHRDSESTHHTETQKVGDEGGDLIPKAMHDATPK